MSKTLFIVSMGAVGLMVLGAPEVFGQNYPNKPIRIVASAVGGGTDFVARIIAQGISESMGQNVIVDNRDGYLPGTVVSQASPDGYTLLVAAASFWIGPLMQKMTYDPVRDFSPITLATSQPNVLVMHPSLPISSVKELIALAKSKPGELNCASSGV